VLDERGVAAEWVVWDDPSADWSSYDAVWIRSTWDYTARHAAFLDWLEVVSATTELWNPAPVVRWNSHKSYLLDLADRGVEVVPTVLVPAGEVLGLDRVLDDQGWTDAVIKPAVSVGAIGAARVHRDDAPGWMPEPHLGDLLVQPMMTGVTQGETSMIAIDGRVTHAVRKIPAAGDFRVHVEYGGREVAHETEPAELELAARALEAVGRPLLYARVDCVDTEKGPMLMELELIEPSLFLPLAPPTAVAALGDAVAARCR
jgi:glutathione synthase/RimK-type ligase-like ATP-grasp enzyme